MNFLSIRNKYQVPIGAPAVIQNRYRADPSLLVSAFPFWKNIMFSEPKVEPSTCRRQQQKKRTIRFNEIASVAANPTLLKA